MKLDPTQVYEYLTTEKGLDHNHAMGMLANIRGESNFDPLIEGDRGTSAGLFQHHASRKDNLIKYLDGDLSNWKGQVDYALSENEGQDYLNSTFDSPEEATEAFTRQFERPSNPDSKVAQRKEFLSEFDFGYGDGYTVEELKQLESLLSKAEKSGDKKTYDLINNELSNFADYSNNIEKAVQKEQEKGFLDTLFEDQPKQEFSGNRVATSTAVGAGIGGALGGVGGAVVGGASGLVGGLAGELARVQGSSPFTTFMAELLGGEAPVATTTVGRNVARALVNYRTSQGIKLLPNTYVTKAEKMAKARLFGDKKFHLNYQTEHFDAAQLALRAKHGLLEESIEGKVSDTLRNKLYRSIVDVNTNVGVKVSPSQAGVVQYGQRAGDTIEQVADPQFFSTSPEMQSLVADIKRLAARDRISPREARSLVKIVSNDRHADPLVRSLASEDTLNLIQNGGTFVREGVEQKKIPEEAQKLLREHFDNFLARTTGEAQYGALKQAEKLEFIAEARDRIPEIIAGKFSKPTSKEFKRTVGFLKSDPQGRNEFLEAVNQHFGSLENTKQMQKEFMRLSGAFRDLGIMSRKEVAHLADKVQSFDSVAAKIQIQETLKAFMLPVVNASQSQAMDSIGVYSL